MTRVLALPFLDPGDRRVDLVLPEGLTIAEIVAHALPGASEGDLARTRIVLWTDAGSELVDPAAWRQKPKAGVRVVIRVAPGDDLLGILSLVVSIAAVALGQLWLGPLLASTLGVTSAAGVAAVSAVATAGLTALGGFLVNLLVPPPKNNQEKPSFAISGFRNQASPDGTVPSLLGRLRFAPPFVVASYTEVVGDLQYIRAVFGLYGPIAISDIKIGDTPITDYDEVEYETREGWPDDPPLTLVTEQVIERGGAVDLRRDKPKNDFGELTGAPSVDQPVKRQTVGDVSGYRIIFSCPSGLIFINKKGKRQPMGARFRLRERLAGTPTWTTVETISIAHKKTEGFFRQYSRTVPVRGAYEIEITRLDDNLEPDENHTFVDRVVLAGIQSIRPEYPIAPDAPMALLAVRIKATYQLNSGLDQVNFVGESIAKDWDAATETWIVRPTRRPASHYRHVLQHPAYVKRVGDERIDLDNMVDWHGFNVAKDLKYDRLHDFGASVDDVLKAVAAAGRASPRDDGLRWSVVIDRPQDVPVDHISPRNARDMRWTQTPFNPPHAFRVEFQDETNDYQSSARLVRWPGYEGPITITERLDLAGITDPTQLFVATRRRQLELIHRPFRVSGIQDGVARVATRGDRVAATLDILDQVQKAARVKAVRGSHVELDGTVEMEEGENYAIRFRVGLTEEDPLGESVVRTVMTSPGRTSGLAVTGTGALPSAGDVVAFGLAGSETFDMRVRSIEPAEDFAGLLRMLPHAPQIDEILDATEIPPWDGRAGGEIVVVEGEPAVPRFVSISSGAAGTGTAGTIVAVLTPGGGSVVTVGTYELRHRLVGAGSWTDITGISAATAGATITGYTTGDDVELQARALSPGGDDSAWTATATVTVGDGDAPIPSTLPPSGITAVVGPGRLTVSFVRDSDPGTRTVKIYANQTGTLNRATDYFSEVIADPGATYSRVLGDPTVANIYVNPDFAASGASWTFGASWAWSGGKMVHTPGASAGLNQAPAFTIGQVWRVGATVSGRTAGSVNGRLFNGTPVDGAAVTANGIFGARLTAVSGNNAVGFRNADPAFDGSIDDAVAYIETPACLAQGDWYVWLEPFNDDGIAGPVSAISARFVI